MKNYTKEIALVAGKWKVSIINVKLNISYGEPLLLDIEQDTEMQFRISEKFKTNKDIYIKYERIR